MELTKELISVTWLFYVVGYVNIESFITIRVYVLLLIYAHVLWYLHIYIHIYILVRCILFRHLFFCVTNQSNLFIIFIHLVAVVSTYCCMADFSSFCLLKNMGERKKWYIVVSHNFSVNRTTVHDTGDSEQTLIYYSPFFRGLIAEKPDASLFFVDTGEKDKETQPRKFKKTSLCLFTSPTMSLFFFPPSNP